MPTMNTIEGARHRIAHVVGGGIGGMAVAGSLAQRGWKVVVHERGSELREIGAGIYLKENSIRVLEELGCLGQIVDTGSRLETSEIRDGSGRSLLHRDVGRERVYTVLRETLHRELASAAGRLGAQIRLNSGIASVFPDGRIQDDSGEEYRADLIVGADGLGSIVRQQAGLQRTLSRMPNGSTRILVPQEASDPKKGSVEYWHQNKRVMVVPIGPDITYFCASSREDDSRGVALPFDIEHWTRSFPNLEQLFGRVKPGNGVHHAHGYVRVSAWHRGRIALIGDAVHGQPPNLGQGAGLAISNGRALAQALDTHVAVPQALESWERDNRKLTEQVQSWSTNWDSFVHRWPTAIEPLRSHAIWMIANFPASRRHWGQLYRGIANQ